MRTLRVYNSDVLVLIDFLAVKLGISKSKAKALLDAKVVFVNGERLWMAKAQLRSGDQVEVHGIAQKSELSKDGLLYEDEQYIIFNKPAGMLSQGAGSIEEGLRVLLSSKALCAVHRLDRDTSGCMLFAKSREIKEKSEDIFRAKKVKKVYHALVFGAIPLDFDEISKPIENKPALTKIQVLATNKVASMVEASIITGRTHQIRKHLASVGHPVLGDREYGTKKIANHHLRDIPRQMLHAFLLGFENPYTGKQISIEAKQPEDFKVARSQLELG